MLKRFAKHSYLALEQYYEFMDESEEARALSASFLETSEFSDRVLGVGRWTPADLPFYVTEANQWGTDWIILKQEGI